ncbi:MAG: gluconate 2-dehydrogenase subunit 3 family protein [Thermodesulfobacteriota bacterium]
MNTQSSKAISRRRFIVSSASLLSLASPIVHLIFWESASLIALAEKPKTDRYKFFNQYQAEVIGELTSLIIPSDGGPGAKEVEAVTEIDKIIAGYDNLKMLYMVGIQLLDSTAKNFLAKGNFLQLDKKEKNWLLKLIDSYGTTNFSNDKIFGNPQDSLTLKLFFDSLKLTTFEIFYSNKLGWEFTGYTGPPQFAGNPDYNDCGL